LQNKKQLSIISNLENYNTNIRKTLTQPQLTTASMATNISQQQNKHKPTKDPKVAHLAAIKPARFDNHKSTRAPFRLHKAAENS